MVVIASNVTKSPAPTEISQLHLHLFVPFTDIYSVVEAHQSRWYPLSIGDSTF
jgi:hypothetical protein